MKGAGAAARAETGISRRSREAKESRGVVRAKRDVILDVEYDDGLLNALT